jgi:hypothetical protein
MVIVTKLIASMSSWDIRNTGTFKFTLLVEPTGPVQGLLYLHLYCGVECKHLFTVAWGANVYAPWHGAQMFVQYGMEGGCLCTVEWSANICAPWHGVRMFVQCGMECECLCTVAWSANICALWHGVRMFVHCGMECEHLCIVAWSVNVCALWHGVQMLVHCSMECEHLCIVAWSVNVCALWHGVWTFVRCGMECERLCTVAWSAAFLSCWVVKCSQWYTWGLQSSGMWQWITGLWLVTCCRIRYTEAHSTCPCCSGSWSFLCHGPFESLVKPMDPFSVKCI